MRPIRIAACVIMSLSGVCYASTDPECLKHLGGAFGDVECFNGLSNDLGQENRSIANAVLASIPKENKNRTLMSEYLRNQVKSQAYCELARQSMTEWMREPAAVNPRYHDYDVAYYECVYKILDQENKFLKTLMKNANQN